MDDDFSTPRAVASVNNLVKVLNGLTTEKEAVRQETLQSAHNLLLELGDVLGIVESPKEKKEEILIRKLMNLILELRKESREKKQYEIADKIREKLKELGIKVVDYPNSTIWLEE